MQESYWTRTLKGRINRRRAMAGIGALSASAAFLVACGGEDEPGGGASTGAPTGGAPTGGAATGGATGGTGATSSGLITEAVDTLKQAKRGGTLRDFTRSEPAHLDGFVPLASLNQLARHPFGTLLKEAPGYMEPSSSVIEGDLAEKWEFSPDHLTLTLKLRPGVTWHDKAPVSGREVDQEDVLFTWRRYIAEGGLRAIVVNEVNPDAPVLSFDAPDSSTIVIKLKEPLAYVHKYFASYGSFTGNLLMYPRESESEYDPRQDMIGHGPWVLQEHTPSVGYKFIRHPTYYDDSFVFPDDMDIPVIPEYASQLAQLKAGNIHLMDMAQYAEDVVPTRNEQTDLQIYARDFTPRTEVVTFGMEGDSPYKDERVRQAISMALDREAMIDAFFGVSKLTDAGLVVNTRWNSHIQAEWEPSGYWLDPKGSEFGENAKYFAFNLEEGKKLLSAAGFPDGFETTMRYPQSTQYSLQRYGEPWSGQLQALGLKMSLDGKEDYTKDYIPNLRDANGRYEGLGMHSVTGTTPQRIAPESDLAAQFWPKGGVTFHGFGEGANGDPELTAIIEKARLEFDDEARKKLVHDAQRYLGKAMWALSQPGGANTFNLAWPAVGNYLVWGEGPQAYWTYRLWLDQTKAPFA